MGKEQYREFLEQPLVKSATWSAALYIRLSKEDGDKQESYSVTSQREILKEYVKQHPDIEIFDYYIDDGWSGTNFDRPSFQHMMDDINSGKINCVIVKDLSRFGRNYTDAGYYLDNVFARLNIRFVALNNGVDSVSNNMNAATKCITVGVQNVINESVAATTSVNVRGTLNVNRSQGKFIGSFASYGYQKDPDDHHRLIIDEEAATVVRQIYKWFLEGKSIIGITKELNKNCIPNPTVYKQQKGWNYVNSSSKGDGLWCDSTVRRMLSNEMYVGNMVQGKNTTISYKIKQCKAIPKEDWIIVKGTHEPIISQDDFDTVQSMFTRHIRTAPSKTEVDLFAGFVKCANCHRAMSKKTNRHTYGTYKYYRCITSNKMLTGSCKGHSVRIDKMENAVLLTIQMLIKTAISLDEVLQKINNKSKKNSGVELLKKSLNNQISERDKYKKMQLDLYPDWKNGVISREEYLSLKQSMTEKIQYLEEKIECITKTIKEREDGVSSDNEFLVHFKKYGNIDKLTRPLLNELVDSILVHEDGNITINFKFKDAYEQLIEYISLNNNSSVA